MVTNAADVFLQEFAECSDPDRAEALLETLVVEHASPAIQRIVREKLAFQSAAGAQDAEEVSAEVAAELTARLRGIKESGGASVGPFAAYAAAAAHHACDQYSRRKYPNRHRLETRLRYLLSAEKGLAAWESRDAEWLCGFARWQSEGATPATKDRLDRWRDTLQEIPAGKSGIHPGDLANTMFERLGAPAPFDAFVSTVARIWGVEDQAAVPESVSRGLGAGESDPNARLELKQWLAELWTRIRELPKAQRTALLLSLRTTGGQAAVALLPLCGVANLRQIADVVEMPADEFAALWNRLPLDDGSIGDALGVSAERVMMLRKSARARLTLRPKS